MDFLRFYLDFMFLKTEKKQSIILNLLLFLFSLSLPFSIYFHFILIRLIYSEICFIISLHGNLLFSLFVYWNIPGYYFSLVYFHLNLRTNLAIYLSNYSVIFLKIMFSYPRIFSHLNTSNGELLIKFTSFFNICICVISLSNYFCYSLKQYLWIFSFFLFFRWR